MCCNLLMNTHKILAGNILEQVSEENRYLINRKKFIWGNIKPDYVSKYKLKKHYYNESIDMIINKIEFLSSLSYSEINNTYGKKKFSAELGVICHFLCDYFCLAHNKRWEFKSNFKRHVSYEKMLSKYAREFKFDNLVCDFLDIRDIRVFISENIKYYEECSHISSDLVYASFVCNSIVNTVFNEIGNNSFSKKRVS